MEELEKVFNKNSVTAEDIEQSSMLRGLQELKYPAHCPYSNALEHKNEGNGFFGKKDYTCAIEYYSEALNILITQKVQSEGNEVNLLFGQLYNNRSAANFYLENYRSAFNYGKMCLKFDKNNFKSFQRCLKCCIYIKDFENFRKLYGNYKNFQIECKDLYDKYIQEKITFEKKNAVEFMDIRKQYDYYMDLFDEIVDKRNIKLLNVSDVVKFKQCLSSHEVKPVKLVDSALTWQLRLLYPEEFKFDILTDFQEDEILSDRLNFMFAEINKESEKPIHVSDINVYIRMASLHGKIRKIENIHLPLKTVLKKSQMENCTPCLYILFKTSHKFNNTFILQNE
ncbi:TPR repeat protein 4 [Intoshia linei]|uniref:TPR repeat protein 4 n=1 Tax=Intoshia linei TaxID=1819745 RepID=A0A177AUH8_9BILA|nr:TPR repeat protein 4 [Intoshia linei]